MKKISGALVLLVILVSDCLPQENNKPVVRLLFYNVENFFDIYDDTIRNDNDFLPDGIMKWNSVRYKKKINSVYKVIAAAGEWDPPAIVGFCEVEKKTVLQDLISDTYLGKYNYGIIHEESGDLRGIDVCLIYRKDLARILLYRYFKPVRLVGNEFNTRSVLYSKMLISDDTIHLFLNHWPSRRGGVLAEESLRAIISDMLKEKIDSISLSVDKHAKIVVAGDFNCTPAEEAIIRLTENRGGGSADKELGMVNLSDRSAKRGIGTYKYSGRWEMIDQVLVSQWLVRSSEGIFCDYGSFRVFDAEFLLRRDPVYPGFIPFSTYRGYRYQGGISDHLPVILDLKKK